MGGAQAWLTTMAATGLPPLRSRRRVDDGFRARATARELGPLRLIELVTPAGECFRDRSLVRPGDAERWQVDLVVGGRVLAEQGDSGPVAAGPADLVLIDPARPVRFRTTATTSVTMLVPRRSLRIGSGDLARLAGVRVRGDRGTGALVSALARELARSLTGLRDDEAARSGAAVVELIAVMLSAQLGARRPVPDASLRDRIIGFIEAGLSDQTLSPASVAAAHHISVRRLHRLFEDEPWTVAAFIRRRRLDRARADLADPAWRELSVAAVGARWGFADPAHFSRLFKRAYGHSPGRHRTRH